MKVFVAFKQLMFVLTTYAFGEVVDEILRIWAEISPMLVDFAKIVYWVCAGIAIWQYYKRKKK